MVFEWLDVRHTRALVPSTPQRRANLRFNLRFVYAGERGTKRP